MSEIAKLRQRLQNVNKNVIEYRMTVAEARSLIIEIDELLKDKPRALVSPEPNVIIQSLDGGSF